MATDRKAPWPLIFGALAVVALAATWWHFRDYFEPPQAQRLPLDDCDLNQGPCSRKLPGGGRLTFEIQPRPVPVVEPLRLLVQVEGVKPRKVEVDFAGVSMNMGYNRPRLERVGPGKWRGEGMLSVCIRDRMDWEAQVLLHLPDKVLAVPFRFDTLKNR